MKIRLVLLVATLAVVLAVPLTARASSVSPDCIPNSSTPIMITLDGISPAELGPGVALLSSLNQVTWGTLTDVVFTSTGLTATATFPAGLPAGTYGVAITQPPRSVFAVGAVDIGCVPAKHPTSARASCSPLLFAPGGATVCSATVTDTARTGQSTPTGTVSFTHSGAGSLYGSPCRLSGSGPTASCSVFFASFPLGGQAITASYGGDATHDTSAGSTLVAVVLPESTNGCLVFGHGQLTAANGDQASFLGLAFAKPPVGAQWYRDNGPANPFRLASTSVDAVTCTPDASHASVFGKAKLNGTGSVEYRIDIQLTAWEHGKDTYRITLSNGYDSGAQPIHHAELDIHLANSDHRHRDTSANQTQGDARDGS